MFENDLWEILWFEIEEDSAWWRRCFGSERSGLHTHLWGDQLLPVVLGLYREQQDEQFAAHRLRALFAQQIVLYLERELKPVSQPSQATRHRRQLNLMIEAVRRDLAADWTLASLIRAAGLHVCPDYFTRLCKQLLGKTPLQLVAEQRMRTCKSDWIRPTARFDDWEN